jgi:hypothetical protein
MLVEAWPLPLIFDYGWQKLKPHDQNRGLFLFLFCTTTRRRLILNLSERTCSPTRRQAWPVCMYRPKDIRTYGHTDIPADSVKAHLGRVDAGLDDLMYLLGGLRQLGQVLRRPVTTLRIELVQKLTPTQRGEIE